MCVLFAGAFRDTSAPARPVRTHMDPSAVPAFFRVLGRMMTADERVGFCAVLAQRLYYDNLYSSSERAREALKLIQSTWRRRIRTKSTPPDMYNAWGLVHRYMYLQLKEQAPTRPYTRTRSTIVPLPDGGFRIQSNTHMVQGHRRRQHGWRELLHNVHCVCKHAVLVDYHWKDTRKRRR